MGVETRCTSVSLMSCLLGLVWERGVLLGSAALMVSSVQFIGAPREEQGGVGCIIAAT